MNVIYHGANVSLFENELAFEQFQKQYFPSAIPKTAELKLHSNLWIGIGLLLLIGAAGYYFYTIKKNREQASSVEDDQQNT